VELRSYLKTKNTCKVLNKECITIKTNAYEKKWVELIPQLS